jgi:hypothetical protein
MIKQHDIFFIRHLVFLYGELKSTFLTKNYYARKGSKYIWRFYIRYISNYFEAIKLFFTSNVEEINFFIATRTPKLKTHGYEFLPNIDIKKIDFIGDYINDYDDKSIIKDRKIDYLKARNFSLLNNFEKIVEEYFKTNKCNFEVQSWETSQYIERDKVQNSLWHRDRDGLKVLKIFIYLRDVGLNSGPHEYVAGSHIIKPLRFVPQIRYTDQSVNLIFEKNRRVLLGNKGTCFTVDTTGLHRSNPPKNVDGRYILNFTYYTGNLIGSENTQEIQLNRL